MIKRKVNLNDIRNVKLSISISKEESKILEMLSKKFEKSKTETLIYALNKEILTQKK
jgi:hypothetical protein